MNGLWGSIGLLGLLWCAYELFTGSLDLRHPGDMAAAVVMFPWMFGAGLGGFNYFSRRGRGLTLPSWVDHSGVIGGLLLLGAALLERSWPVAGGGAFVLGFGMGWSFEEDHRNRDAR